MMQLHDPRQTTPACTELGEGYIIHENPWFSVRNRGGYFTVECTTPQVMVLPIVDHQAVVMVQPKRPVLSDAPLELPAGSCNPGESPVKAMARELAEETGMYISDLKRFRMLPPLCIIPRDPFLPFLAEIDVSLEEFETRKGHDDEIEKVNLLSFGEVKKKICSGEIYLAYSMAVLGRKLLMDFI